MDRESRHPAEIDRERLAARQARAASLERYERRLSWVRLVVAIAAIVVVFPAVFDPRLHWSLALVFPTAFAVLAAFHERLDRRRVLATRAADWYSLALDRLDDRWVGRGRDGGRFADPAHPYAADLDLFGTGSLFELICAARTAGGERTLADWLRAPAPPDEIRARHRAVDELRDRLDLREDLAVAGADVADAVDGERLAAWGGSAPRMAGRWLPWAAGALGLANLLTLLGWIVPLASRSPDGIAELIDGAGPFAVAAAASLLFTRWLRPRAEPALAGAEAPLRELRLLSEVLGRLESERFGAPRLAALRARLEVDGAPPSRRIAALGRLVEINEWRRNMVFRPLADLLLLGTALACALERWRARCGPHLRDWVAALGEFEALASLAGYAFEHPADPFPEIVDSGPLIEARGIGHPLIPDGACVRNDVTLGRPLRLLIVSGSNMSGKSTLLRTIGINVVLAQAGAPVRADLLRLGPLGVGASMRVVDSLQQGVSHFYAEIRRLRAIVELAAGGPLLFLLDEILHGTNSHDRRIGAEAVVRGLVARGAIGLVTTHDLALARIAVALGESAANVHFVDHLDGDRVVFDYRLRDGVVDRSNALALMRAVGLDVDRDDVPAGAPGGGDE